ncbi:NAD(P)/FAD-dependent oxidoreductase [bacterium]|nr:NAD(P)/FAD-dependent oxidoreductase [bacterium]
MIYYDTIIVGGGAGALFCAANLRKGKTLLLEKNDKLGRKLLLAGSGKCNITNSCDSKEFLTKYGKNGEFLKKGLYKFGNLDLINFFVKNGLPIFTNKNGKVFPKSESSKDVLELLVKLAIENGVKINRSSTVLEITKIGELFIVKTLENEYRSKYVVLATGGSSFPFTGSSGDGYSIAKQLGHTIIPIKPALTPLYFTPNPFAELTGISFEKIGITLFKNGKKFLDTIGDIGFTHKGLSGPGILDISRYFDIGDKLNINFTKNGNINSFIESFKGSAKINGKVLLKTFLKKFDFPESFIEKFFPLYDKKIAEIGKKDINEIAKTATSFELIINEIGNLYVAMSTAGGVSLKEVNDLTFSSKIIDNLYFSGEILDLDGDTGGFNLQAAFTTAFCVAKEIEKRY